MWWSFVLSCLYIASNKTSWCLQMYWSRPDVTLTLNWTGKSSLTCVRRLFFCRQEWSEPEVLRECVWIIIPAGSDVLLHRAHVQHGVSCCLMHSTHCILYMKQYSVLVCAYCFIQQVASSFQVHFPILC